LYGVANAERVRRRLADFGDRVIAEEVELVRDRTGARQRRIRSEVRLEIPLADQVEHVLAFSADRRDFEVLLAQRLPQLGFRIPSPAADHAVIRRLDGRPDAVFAVG
jgi:hypothetical protein